MHTIIHPTIDRAPDGTFTDNAVLLTKVGETEDAIIVSGARILATLAPFSDELAVYPAFPLPGEAPDSYAFSFALGMHAPGLVFLSRYRTTDAWDAPLRRPVSARLNAQ